MTAYHWWPCTQLPGCTELAHQVNAFVRALLDTKKILVLSTLQRSPSRKTQRRKELCSLRQTGGSCSWVPKVGPAVAGNRAPNMEIVTKKCT